MSDTPETDSCPAERIEGLCGQLERERDEARRLLAAAKESLNAIHVEVGGWIGSMMKGGK
jgi:hypothetical protein